MSASYWAALLPAASLIAAVATYASDPPEGTDEVDVLPGLWIVLSAVAVVICLAAAAVRRRARRRPRPASTEPATRRTRRRQGLTTFILCFAVSASMGLFLLTAPRQGVDRCVDIAPTTSVNSERSFWPMGTRCTFFADERVALHPARAPGGDRAATRVPIGSRRWHPHAPTRNRGVAAPAHGDAARREPAAARRERQPEGRAYDRLWPAASGARRLTRAHAAIGLAPASAARQAGRDTSPARRLDLP